MTLRRPWWPVLLAGLLLALASGCTAPEDRTVAASSAEPSTFVGGTAVKRPYAMPDVVLTDASGASYDLATSPSKPVTLLFFGYTHCPDVCIAVLSDVALTLQRLEPDDRSQVQVVFVTTDPVRDTGPVIRAYLDRFDSSFVGLTGDLPAIVGAAAEVGVDIRGTQRLPSGGYDVGHSAQVVGFERERGVVMWPPGTSVKAMRADVTALVDRSR